MYVAFHIPLVIPYLGLTGFLSNGTCCRLCHFFEGCNSSNLITIFQKLHFRLGKVRFWIEKNAINHGETGRVFRTPKKNGTWSLTRYVSWHGKTKLWSHEALGTQSSSQPVLLHGGGAVVVGVGSELRRLSEEDMGGCLKNGGNYLPNHPF